MELDGPWRAAESSGLPRSSMADPGLDDSGWATAPVPGHWRSVPTLEGSDGPVLYRTRFTAERPGEEERVFLAFDGIFYQGDVWLDGEYVGDTEGYFAPHHFEVTDALRRQPRHVLAVEVTCSRPSDAKAKKNLTGVFQHWDCIDPGWNPGGIWRSVRLERTGPIRISSLRVLCREATAERAVLELEASLDSPQASTARVRTVLRPDGSSDPAEPRAAEHDQVQVLAAGTTVVRWRVAVERPELWWPRSLGSQPLYRLDVSVHPADAIHGPPSDERSVTTGLRQVRLRDFVATINGERVFLKGANYGPARRDLAAATPEEVGADVESAAAAGLDLLRIHAHVGRPELYEAADRLGVLIWQDLPLQWAYGNVRHQAVIQAREAVHLLGHHPSVAVWCGHNEPVAVDAPPGRPAGLRNRLRVAAGQALPTWNKTALDRSIRRALDRADGTRTVVAHSGVVPHPAWGTDSHLYFGWYHGRDRDLPGFLARLPVLARFVSEFGAQAVPDSAEFMQPERWPDLDWETLEARYCYQRHIFESRVPPADHPTFESWRNATQEYQAALVRYHIETLRRLKYRPCGGFCVFMLADAQPAVTWSLLDHRRRPKAAYRALAEACAPVVVIADRPAERYAPGDRLSLAVHVVSDLRAPLAEGTVDATLRWPGGQERWRFAGEVGADACARVGRLSATLPSDTPAGRVTLDLSLRWAGGSATNRYESRVVR